MGCTPTSIKAMVNFAKDRSDGGRFSNWDPEQANMNLTPVEIEVANIRHLADAPSLDREGFTLVDHAIEGDWYDRAWLEDHYVPSCLELVKRLTGAKAALQMYTPFVRSAEHKEGAAGTASFIHLDQPRAEYAAQAREWAAEAGMTMERGAIYNVWKAISPPPQSQPLALCDRRAVSEFDYVRGYTVEKNDVEAPYIGIAVPASPMKMYYAPDMEVSESLVFVSADFEPANPLGCPHQAISPPVPADSLVARVSVEVRVLAIFD